MLRLLILNNIPILEQLRLEEALLRTSQDNWCILNTGSAPAIVMGISGKPENLLDIKKVANDKIPVIKRFSGGGTVYIDHDTVFATFICNQTFVDVPLQPKPILKWSETFYQPLFKGFSLQENDYAFGDKKFGGNAQYIQKGRWLLHTSFLWDYTLSKMEYLLLPDKRPAYRGMRSHADFLCTLRPLFTNKQILMQAFAEHIKNCFPTNESSIEDVLPFLNQPHRKATTEILL